MKKVVKKTSAAKTKKSASKACAKSTKACAKPAEKATVKAEKKVVPATCETPAVPAADIKEAAKKLTRIVAQFDVGWGHQLYIRGEGAGLSWEQGVPMICENDVEWHWVAETETSPIVFKVLIDDKIWSLGENVSINAGDIHISSPKFF